MRTNTEIKFKQLLKNIGNTYNVSDVAESFNVEPSIAQKLQDKIVEKSVFLQKTNTVPVDEMIGDNILGSIDSPIASRTQTTDDIRRQPKDALNLSSFGYQLFETESDIAIKFKTIDAWAKFPNLYEKYQEYSLGRMANDRELTSWYGEFAADNSDITTYPLLEDMNIGWLQYMRNNLPANILTEGAVAGQIRFGDGGDYTTLDRVIADLVGGIPVFLRANLVALIGDDLVTHEKERIYGIAGDLPSEKVNVIPSLKHFGGVSAWETPSNFPARGLVITSYKNLSFYYQEDSWRRSIVREDSYKRYADYNSRNEGYVVETPEKFVGLEFKNVLLPGEFTP